MVTTCLSQAMYLLRRALNSRGFAVDEHDLAFHVQTATGTFRLSFLPGNRRVLISSHVHIVFSERGQGLGRKMLKLRDEIAKECGANLLLATVREDNPIQVHLLETSGWKRFNKRETGVCLWGKEL